MKAVILIVMLLCAYQALGSKLPLNSNRSCERNKIYQLECHICLCDSFGTSWTCRGFCESAPPAPPMPIYTSTAAPQLQHEEHY